MIKQIVTYFLFILTLFSCAQTSTTYLTKDTLQKKTPKELQLIYNELYAKKGFIFKDSILLAHFNKTKWYKPSKEFVLLNDKEKSYLKLIFEVEKRKIDKQKSKSINDKIPNDTIEIKGYSPCVFLEEPIYIINKTHVIFQDCNTRKIIYPNIETFKIPKNISDSGIAIDKNGVYYKGNFIEIDTTGLEIVGRNNEYSNYKWLWKTKKKAFVNTQELKKVDAETFTTIGCLNGSYFKDKNFIYYFDKMIEGSDGGSVNETCNDLCYDKNFVYREGKKMTYKGESLKPINDFFFKTNSIVLDKNMKEITNIDTNTFIGLTRKYSIDKNGLYFEGEITKVKPENLKNVKVWDQINSAYFSDGIQIYSHSNYLEPDYDATTFGMLPQSDFCYDKNGIYKRDYTEERGAFNKKFPFNYTESVSDKNTFISVRSPYLIYMNQAYDLLNKKVYKNLNTEKIAYIKEGGSIVVEENGDISSKEDLGYQYYKLNNKIFYNEKELKQVDFKSFQPISYYYSKDKNFVYTLSPKNECLIFKGIDVNNFILFPNTPFAIDKSFLYFGTKEMIENKNLQLLAIYPGYRKGCSRDASKPSNIYFFQNSRGYWIVETSEIIKTKFLGKEFNPKWNKLFENFQLIN